MATINFNRFEVGIDLRKGPSESDANRLRDLKNAYISNGWQIQKRPGLWLVASLEPGTSGLVASNGKLHTFYSQGTVTHANALFQSNKVAHPSVASDVAKVHDAFSFNGYIYAAVEYANGDVYHHYLDGTTPTHVTDVNCPHSKAIERAASKVFAIDPSSDVVRFSATNAPRDWTTLNDAGFLPTGIQVGGDPTPTTLGYFDRRLVVFSADTMQTWNIDPDPAAMSLANVVENIGTIYAQTPRQVASDLYFLTEFGYRSVVTQAYTNNLADVDVGSPVDKLVRESLVAGAHPMSVYYNGAGQYWTVIGGRVHVYTHSKAAKLAAWSYYDYPFSVDAIAELKGVLYLRSGNNVYRVDESVRTDNGENYEVVAQIPYMNLKKPGALKQIWGLDAVMQGSAEIQVLFDVRDELMYQSLGTVSGDSRPGGQAPVGVMGTDIALKFINNDDQDWRLDSTQLYFETLGVVA